MAGEPAGEPQLHAALVQAGLTVPELWLRYLGLGGTATAMEIADYIAGGPGGPFDDDLEHDTLVQALNERFMELDLGHPVPYHRDERGR